MANSPMAQIVLEVEERDSRKPPRSEAGRNRAWKRRAAKACISCRVRKVRCDVILVGPGPCTNCKYDETECCVTPKKTRRESNKITPKAGVFILENEIAPSVNCAAGIDILEQFCEANLQEWRDHSVKKMDLDEQFITKVDSLVELPIVSSNKIEEQLQMPTASQLLISNATSWADLGKESQPISHSGFPLSISTSTPAFSPVYSVSSDHTRISHRSLLRRFKPFHARIEPDELEYLQRMGAFAVPPPPLQDALLRCYVEFVHGQCPMLDLRELSDIVRGDQQDKRISLLLFQALMFAGSTWVSLGRLKQAGFKSREDAQAILFKRVRLLYNSDCEPDHMSVIQALVLMTFSKQPMSEGKDSWHWLGIAISLCYRFVHRNTLPTSMTPEKKRLWRRIWWSCFIRDRTLALREGRPVRINVQDCDVPMLCIEDFAVDNDDELGEMARISEVAERCIEKAILCWCSSSQQLGQHTVSLKHPPTAQNSPSGWETRPETTVHFAEPSCHSSSDSPTASTTSASHCSDCRRDCHDDMLATSSSSTESSPMASEMSEWIAMPSHPTKELSEISDFFTIVPEGADIERERTYWDDVENATPLWFGRIIV